MKGGKHYWCAYVYEHTYTQLFMLKSEQLEVVISLLTSPNWLIFDHLLSPQRTGAAASQLVCVLSILELWVCLYLAGLHLRHEYASLIKRNVGGGERGRVRVGWGGEVKNQISNCLVLSAINVTFFMCFLGFYMYISDSNIGGTS